MQKKLELANKVGPYLKYCREQKGYSLAYLGEMVGISSSYIYKIEKGERLRPSFVIINKICNCLGISAMGLLEISSEEEVYENVEKRGYKTLPEVILTQEFVINGLVITSDIKNVLVKLYEVATEKDWNEATKISNTLELVHLIDLLREQIQ